MVLTARDFDRGHDVASVGAELQTLVMGLHWAPADEQGAHPAADLDALCALFDTHGHVLEVVHPGHTHSGNGAVMHTGDSRKGASHWDDERIFVFLKALPPQVAELAFMVTSSAQRPFEQVRGASCHLSDHDNETELLRVDLTALATEHRCTVAILCRAASGWRVRVSEPEQGARASTAP